MFLQAGYVARVCVRPVVEGNASFVEWSASFEVAEEVSLYTLSVDNSRPQSKALSTVEGG